MAQLRVPPAADGGAARGGAHEREQDAQRRRLARAVGAEEAGDASGLDAGGEVVDGANRAECLRDPTELEEVSFGHRHPLVITAVVGRCLHPARSARAGGARGGAETDGAGNVASVSDAAEPTVLVRTVRGVGHLTLNRPRAINALDLGMIQTISAALDRWEHDADIEVVLLDGAGERGLCAGETCGPSRVDPRRRVEETRTSSAPSTP
jgi:hypothetical protein